MAGDKFKFLPYLSKSSLKACETALSKDVETTRRVSFTMKGEYRYRSVLSILNEVRVNSLKVHSEIFFD